MLKIESKKPIPTVLKIVSKKLIPAVREIVPKKPIPAGLKIDPKKTIPPVFKSVMNQLSSDSQKFVSKESRWKSKFKLTNVTSPELLKNPWSEGRPKVPQERRILWSPTTFHFDHSQRRSPKPSTASRVVTRRRVTLNNVKDKTQIKIL